MVSTYGWQKRRRTIIEDIVIFLLVGTFLLIMAALNFSLGLNSRWREQFMSRQLFRPRFFIPFERFAFLSSGVLALLLGLLVLAGGFYLAFGK